jgi:PAS domain S-box-containing protein
VTFPRILTLVALAAAGVALLLGGAALSGPESRGDAVTPAVLVVAGAVLLLVAGALRERRPPDVSRGAASAPSARTAFGPALDAAEAVAVCSVDRQGRLSYWNAGAEKLFGLGGREVEGAPITGKVVPAEEESDLLAEIERTFETGRSRGVRRTAVTGELGRRADAVYALVPLLRYGKVVEVALVFVETRPAGLDDRYERLLDGSPAGLLGVDGEGRIESANRRFAEWTGRRVEVLEGMDVERAAVLPEELRRELRALARLRRRAGELPEPREFDETLLTPDGDPRSVHVVAAARPGGGADVLLVDAASRRRLAAELAAVRGALAEAREAAAEAIVLTTRDLEDSVERIAAAVRRSRDERSGPLQRAAADEALDETTREILKRLKTARSLARAPVPSVGAPAAPAVLLVEDNEENRELLAHMLRSRGADVVACGSGREALEAAARERFTFVLLDLQMPEMDGHQVLQRLRALPGGEHLPVVALTALTSEDVRHRCEAEGMNDFVTKPVTLGRIRELVDRWGTPSARVSRS